MRTITKQKGILFLILGVIVLFVSGCADSENVKQCLTGHTYGFFGGLWHGFIAPFDFVGMLFDDSITVYAQNNNGGLYALGFLIGSGGWGFFSSKGATRVRTRKVHVQNQTFDDAVIVE